MFVILSRLWLMKQPYTDADYTYLNASCSESIQKMRMCLIEARYHRIWARKTMSADSKDTVSETAGTSVDCCSVQHALPDAKDMAKVSKKQQLLRQFNSFATLGELFSSHVVCLSLIGCIRASHVFCTPTWEGLLALFTFGLGNGVPAGLVFGYIHSHLARDRNLRRESSGIDEHVAESAQTTPMYDMVTTNPELSDITGLSSLHQDRLHRSCHTSVAGNLSWPGKPL